MGKYKLSELLTEVAGGRIGTLEISARDLVRKMEELEDKGVRVERFDGLSPDGKTYIEFHVHPIRKYDEDYSFSVYDFKFGFDPMSQEHADKEYPFSVGGRSAARDSAETVLRGGDMGYQINEDEFDEARQSAIESSQKAAGIKEDMSKKDSLKKEMMMHVDQLMDGNIDMEDFMNVVEEIMLDVKIAAKDEELKMKLAKEVMGIDRRGNKKPDTDGSDATKFKKAAMSEDSIEEALPKFKGVPPMKDIVKALKNDAKATDSEIKQFMASVKKAGDEFDDVDDYVEDFKNYIADKALQEHFNRFK